MKTTINILYITILSIIIIAIGYSSMYLFETAGDSLRYSYGKTGLEYATYNFFESNGRWGQGLTNDYRLYSIRGFTAAFSLFFFLSGVFYLFYFLFKKKTEALVLTLSFYFSIIFSLVRFYPFTFNMCMVMSYTFGLGLLFFLIPLLYQYNKTNSKIKLFFILFIVIFTSGLLEIYGLIVLFTLGSIIFFNYVKNKQIIKSYVFFFLLAIFFNALTYFSPGNINRRKLNDSSLGFDVSTFTDIYITTFENIFSINTLVFFLLVGLIVFKNKQTIINPKTSKLLILIYGFLLTIIPILLLVYAVKEKAVRFDRVHNISTVLSILFCFIIIYSISTKFKGKLKDKLYNVLLLFPLIVFLVTYSKSDNKFEPKKVYSQIVSGDLKTYYYEEMARRDYLLSDTSNKIKTIPSLSHKNYKGTVIGLGNENRSSGLVHRSYKNVFNNGKNIIIKKNYPDPLVFSSVYFLSENVIENLVNIYIDENLEIYFNKKYQTILIKKKAKTIRDYKISYAGNVLLSDWKKEQSKYLEFYENYTDILGFKIDGDLINSLKVEKQTEQRIATSQKNLIFNLKINIKKEDKITLFYLLNDTYNQKQSITKSVKGNNTLQNITFSIPLDERLPDNFRFDYATKPNQEIEIKEIEIIYEDKTFVINQNQVKDYFNSPNLWNKVIDINQAKYGVKKHKNRIDSKLIGNKKLSAKLKTL